MLLAMLYPKASFPLLSFFGQCPTITIPQGCLHFLPTFSWVWGYSSHTQRHQNVCSQDLWKSFLPWDWIGPLFSLALNKQNIFMLSRNGNVFPRSWTSAEKPICSVFNVTTSWHNFWMPSIIVCHYQKNLERMWWRPLPHHNIIRLYFPIFLYLNNSDFEQVMAPYFRTIPVKYLKLQMWRGAVPTSLASRHHY